MMKIAVYAHPQQGHAIAVDSQFYTKTTFYIDFHFDFWYASAPLQIACTYSMHVRLPMSSLIFVIWPLSILDENRNNEKKYTAQLILFMVFVAKSEPLTH